MRPGVQPCSEEERMNKTKRVAWHKHLKKDKKRREKAAAATAARPAQTRR
jgi:hypothetical protein